MKPLKCKKCQSENTLYVGGVNEKASFICKDCKSSFYWYDSKKLNIKEVKK